jgi:DNA-3-methyladenine glycosylase II
MATTRASGDQAVSSLDLHPTPPYRLDLTAWALRRRRLNRIDRWDGTYRRAVSAGEHAVAVRVTQLGTRDEPHLRVDLSAPAACDARELSDVRAKVIRLLGVDVDLRPFYALADAHPLTRALRERFLGLRPPRFTDLFEALVNAIANQQLSLEVGLTLLNRLAANFGTTPPGADEPAALPSPGALLAAAPHELRELGFSTRKAEYLRGVAQAITTGAIDETSLEGMDRAEATRCLTGLAGIGRWSAEYVLLRGLGRLDVYPGDDVGARHKLRSFFGLDHDPGYDEVAERLRPWEPYTGMLYFHLLLDGLAERGELTP